MGFREDNKPLFREGDLGATLEKHYGSIQTRVDSISREILIANSEDELVEHFRSSMALEPIELDEGRMFMEQKETNIDVTAWSELNLFGEPGPIYVPGMRVSISIPFSGTGDLWFLRPHSFWQVYPRGNILPDSSGDGVLQVVIEQPTNQLPERTERILKNTLSEVKQCLDYQRPEIERRNGELADKIRQAIREHRRRLEVHEGIAKSLNIPLKRREDAPSVLPMQMRRKLVRPLAPAAAKSPADHGISDDDYTHILSVIRHEGRTFEATPVTYSVLEEEDLLNIMLAHLNGHYQGDATGETFRRKGKTDIRIEAENRAAFVAECKVWRAATELLSAIEQLLGYMIWRDCKAPIVIFNKHNSGFVELLQKVPSSIAASERFKKDLGPQGDGEWRYVLTSPDDKLREVVVHVFLFNLYVKGDSDSLSSETNP